MSDSEYKVQWSVSLPPCAQYAKGHMLNVKGNSVAEVEELFDEILRDKFIDKAIEVASFLVAAQTVNDAGATPVSGGQQTANQSQQSSGHTCPHGERKYVTGNGRTGAWAGYFCPLPKGDANQCKPEFEDA